MMICVAGTYCADLITPEAVDFMHRMQRNSVSKNGEFCIKNEKLWH